MMRRIVALTALAVILAACSTQVSETFSEIGLGLDGGDAVAPEPSGAGEEARTVKTERLDIAFEVTSDRRVIREASLSLHASDTRDVFDRIVAITEASGGFVASADVQPVEIEEGQPVISMTLRVPVDQLSTVMGEIKDSADEVVSETQNASDVTEQFVDLEAQLVNLEALEVELRALLEEVRQQPDADPDKLLRVFNEISSVRGQIEQIQGQLQYLSNLTDLATISVFLTQTPQAVPIVEEPWAPAEAAKDALRSLITSLQGMADWVIGFAIYTLPVLILTLALPGLAVYLGYRWWRGRRRPPGAEPAQA